MVFNEINTNHKGRGGKQYLPIHGTGAKKTKSNPTICTECELEKGSEYPWCVQLL